MCVARSKEEREAALLRMRACGRSRVGSKTADESGSLAAITYEMCIKQLERLAAESTDDGQAVLQRLRIPTCMRRLKRMTLLQARPTMLCIH